jgi:hypothetical protein
MNKLSLLFFAIFIGLAGLGVRPAPALSQPAITPLADPCPALPPPTGTVVNVDTVAGLESAVNNAVPGVTISIADGEYDLNGAYLWIDTPNVTLRSASGNREAVVLNGNYATTEIVSVAASNITIADLTLREAYNHPIHVMSSDHGDTLDTLIYNVHVIDPGQQAIKINPAAAGYYTDDGVIACSHIELTDAGRAQVRDNCYTGGVDAHQSWGWTIRDNLIEGFWCDSGLSEHGIHLWVKSRGTLVERNLLRDNARGIGFGLVADGDGRVYSDDPCPAAGGAYVDHYEGIIRNNAIFASRGELFASESGFDCGICLWQACGAQVLHNTVVSTQAPFSSIEWRFDWTEVDLVNNLVSHNLMDRGGAANLAGNLQDASLSLFVDGVGGDLHLASTAAAAIDQGAALAAGLCDDDFDGDARPIGAARDIGADEYGLTAPSVVTNLRVTQAITGTGTLTVTLGWTSPDGAESLTLRYAASPITESNWASATDLATLPGSAATHTASVPYGGGQIYFALKSQGAGGESGLSNNAFWPVWWVYLPLLRR